MKRLIDVAVAIFALLVLVPVIIGIAILVRGALGSPVFFRQQRAGFHGNPFYLIKFRTMLDKQV